MRVLILAFLYSITFGKTWIVDDDGVADYITVQEAINSASDGDTIFVKNGIYKPFFIPSVEITIIGESNQDTKIDNLDNRTKYSVTIATTKGCKISNFKLTNTAINVGSYNNYSILTTVPQLIIDNCVFDSTDVEYIGGIWIDIDYYGYVNTFHGDPDSLINAFHIHNNTFINRYEAIVFAAGGIVGKRFYTNENNLKVLNLDGEQNYYGVSDSSEIQKLIIDFNNPSSEDTNYVLFDFDPWSDTLITGYHQLSKAGIKFNNFINCDNIFISGLEYPSTVGINEIKNLPNEFEVKELYPNPFNPSTKIQYKLLKQMKIKIRVFNSIGEEINGLSKEKVMSAGIYTESIDFINQPSGIYFINISNSKQSYSLKAVLLK